MALDILETILRGFLTLFYNPLFYFLIAALFLTGWQRVRRERRSFGIKVYGVFNSVIASIVPSLLIGLSGSVVLLVMGIALPIGFIALISVCFFVTMLTTQLRFLSPALAIGLAAIVAIFLPDFHTGVNFINQWIMDVRQVSFQDIGVFLAVATLLEAFAVLVWGKRQTSPRLINGKRGKKVGAHEANQLWIAPLFFLIPVSGHIHPMSWWPLADGAAFSLGLLPLGIGLQQLITHTLPEGSIRKTGTWMFMTGLGTAILAAVGFFFEPVWCVLAAGIFAIISRLLLVYRHHYDHSKRPFYFTDRGNGLRIVGVVPNSPAAKMNVSIGETVEKVNGQAVRSEDEFYQALQINPTYCKMDILNHEDEVHFVKGMIVENELHKIGLLFLEPSKRAKDRRPMTGEIG